MSNLLIKWVTEQVAHSFLVQPAKTTENSIQIAKVN